MTKPEIAMATPNTDAAFKNIQTELSITRAFLRQLAKHLVASDMDGQAGNCTIRADGLTSALYSLDFLSGLNIHD